MGNHVCLAVVTSWHTLQIGLYIWSAGVSLTQRNYAWALNLQVPPTWVGVKARDRCMGIQFPKGSGANNAKSQVKTDIK